MLLLHDLSPEWIEKLPISLTNTGSYPWTVMIKTLNTMTTSATMARARCSYNFTVWTY
jgi:hypothetical protein